MELAVTEEQAELRAALRRFFTDKAPSATVRKLMETEAGYDTAVWAQMGEQLGLQGLAIPEEHGGAGFGFAELAVVFEEMGRTLFPSPFLASAVLAPQALLASTDASACADLLPGIADGSTVATVAFCERDGRWDGSDIQAAARPSGEDWILDGVKHYVLDGHVADLVLVFARTELGLSLFAVDGTAPGVARTPLPTLDQTRRLARVTLEGAPGRLVGSEGTGLAVLRRVVDLASVVLAAEALGGAQRCLDLSVEYAKVRRQFGRPIGSFQAIKHKCADLLTLVESSRSAAMYAARVADQEPEALASAASLAKSYCADAFFTAAGEAIQIHGGIGFTWEHDAHLFFKRAKSSQLLFGTPALHRDRLAASLGI
ncbi:acyl-CoA dehydrogenase family protein [Actinocorallia longicatena]|uniref:Acyl-CoA dehydrogenase family protein n=1 Tax=Actinocorallia longicatena TaxID=111803 RepID=A0ABP6QGF5_9ACTN